jgi:hypothetical protein
MHALIFYAIGIFFNPVTGDTQQAIALVDSVTECAQLVNDNRVPVETDTGTYYLIDALCGAVVDE